jgi:hypothetical protein
MAYVQLTATKLFSCRHPRFHDKFMFVIVHLDHTKETNSSFIEYEFHMEDELLDEPLDPSITFIDEDELLIIQDINNRVVDWVRTKLVEFSHQHVSI